MSSLINSPDYAQYLIDELDRYLEGPLSPQNVITEIRRHKSAIEGDMIEDDLEHYLTRDYIAPASDGGVGAETHPRAFGTFPRVLRRYVFDKQVITLPFLSLIHI